MLLSVPCPALLGSIQADAHNIEPGAGEDGHHAVLRPSNPKGMLQGLRQAVQDIRKAPTQGLCDEQRRPDYEKIEEQVNGHFACSGWLVQSITSHNKGASGDAGSSVIHISHLSEHRERRSFLHSPAYFLFRPIPHCTLRSPDRNGAPSTRSWSGKRCRKKWGRSFSLNQPKSAPAETAPSSHRASAGQSRGMAVRR